MTYLEFNHVFKQYHKKTVINDFHLSVEEGEFIVIVGPSGCGKSTTLRMLAGLENITQGNIYLNQVCINETPPKNRDIAMVFQNYALYPHMRVFDNLAYGLKVRRFSSKEIKQKVNKVAEMLQLQDLLELKPNTLSGGQRQRVAMGRAIARDPKVFLFDEPLSNLDVKLRVQMRLHIESLQRKLGTTTLFVTHDQIEAMTMAHRIVVMQSGMIEQIGTPEEIYHHPDSVFVAQFVGSPEMNIIPVTIDNNKLQLGETVIGVKNISEDTILIGIRPEHFSISDNDHESFFTAKIHDIEFMGTDQLVYATLLNQHQGEVIIRLTSRSELPHLGSEIGLYCDLNTIHFFSSIDNKRMNNGFIDMRL